VDDLELGFEHRESLNPFPTGTSASDTFRTSSQPREQIFIELLAVITHAD
jgi:hypothetical protein